MQFQGNTIQERFLEAVKSLGLRFPVARISEKTEYNSGIVSEYLKGKKEVSEKFIKAFCESYKIDPKDILENKKQENGNTSQNLNINENIINNSSSGLAGNVDMSRLNNGITGVKFVPLLFQGEYFNNRLNHSYMKQLPIIIMTGLPYADPTHRVFEVGITHVNDIKKGELLMCETVDISTFEQYEAHLIVTDKGIITAYLAKKNDDSVVWYGEDGKQHKIQISSIGEIWKPLHKYEPYISKKKVVEV